VTATTNQDSKLIAESAKGSGFKSLPRHHAKAPVSDLGLRHSRIGVRSSVFTNLME